MAKQGSAFLESYQQFLEIEEELDLFDITIDDIYLWERIRTWTRVHTLQDTETINYNIKSEIPNSEYMKILDMTIKNLFFKNPFFADEHDILFYGRGRRTFNDGEWWEIHCDPIHHNIELDCVQLELPFEFEHKTPARTKNLRYLDMLHYIGTLKRKLGLIDCEFDPETRNMFANIEDRFKKTFSADIDIEKAARVKILEQRAYVPLYKKILKRVDPEIALLVKSSGKEPFIDACEQMDIPTVEIQHGAFHPYNCNYSFPGYRTKRSFPDYFFSFGDYWQEQIPFPLPDERIFSTGFPYLEMKAEQLSDVESCNQVLFISQNMIQKQLSQFAAKFSYLVDDVDIVYKLHPGEEKADHPELLDADVELVDGQDSIYPLLAKSRYFVGATSTSVFEGIRFGLEPYLVDLPVIQMRKGLLECEGVTLVSTPSELSQNISDEGSKSVDGDAFFRPQSTDEIQRRIQQITARDQ